MHSKNIDPKAKKVRITYVRSVIGYDKTQKGTIKALGLRKLGQTVEQINNPAVRGMIDSVGHLVEVEAIK
ncbi:MAG: 50S ribosomal protein L30 [Caldilineae bacterium]|nr:50S ribosomal protein L30 [Anaerolineae bacterium]MCB0198856.1 50S ribosomal protein L30 [Anaerolineae bacterium]MCB0203319.1 50S ribosomal protein L30 [Anaerolineae bacterium]MCB0252850.1 50S ribosomal protein L30 [Anaerolineae bacterium]MCB9153547.1 50S ribosomal protein L30 [Caldilineae bacterium]